MKATVQVDGGVMTPAKARMNSYADGGGLITVSCNNSRWLPVLVRKMNGKRKIITWEKQISFPLGDGIW